jgi:hypothetical protein
MRPVRFTRRQLQVVLGCLWLLDGALQLQPFMLGTGFARQIMALAAAGQPTFVASPIRWAAGMIAAHPVVWDVPFAAVQLLIGVGLLVPRTVRLALGASLAWSLGVWYFGEGLGGIAGGHASLLTGAPGAALLYGVLGAAAWPRRDRPAAAPASWLRFVWAAVWTGGAVLQALPGQNTGPAVADALGGGGGWVSRHGLAVVVALVALEALIGIGALARPTRPVAAAAGFVLTAGIWVFAQDYGGLATGRATDPNTAPLLALMALALRAGPPGLAGRISVDRSRDHADDLLAGRLRRRSHGDSSAVA